jgi:hypothetical protein
MRSFGLVYLHHHEDHHHHHHHHHRQNSFFLAITFLGRFCPLKVKGKAIPVTGREGP